MRKHLTILHRLCALLALLTIASFFGSTLVSELSGKIEWVVTVKHTIAYAVWGLIVLMAVTAITGVKLAPPKGKGPKVFERKMQRMPIIALNGLLILLPCALYLNHLASQQIFDGHFIWVQAIELLTGAVNLTLMTLNVRDMIKMRDNN